MLPHYIKKILRARVYDVATETPLELAVNLSRRLNNRVLIKREDLQPVFSFKIRGAYNKIVQLSEAEKAAGIITASAGNHAQGVALTAQKLGIEAQIVMPKTTPDIKVQAVKNFGVNIIQHGNSYDDAGIYAKKLAKTHNLTYIPPYDDPEVIAGQGTVAMEILHQHSQDIEAIFVPVGGGGLIAGIAAYVKYIRPDIKIIGVEPEDAACLKAALAAGHPVTLPQVGIFADGVAVARIGDHPFEIVKKWVDDVICVNTDEICAAIKDIFDDTRVVTEPAGALALAGLKAYVSNTDCKDQNLIAIASGANINFDRLQYVAERTEVGEKREILLAVTIDEKPGSFRRFCHTLGNATITEFNYRYADKRQAQIFVGVRVSGLESERQALIDKLARHDYPLIDLSDNDMAKEHVRHMVGGHCHRSDIDNTCQEHICRFIFPERPGALLHFLTEMGQRWNISLFHYRNHAAAYGRVLMGVQVCEQDLNDFKQFLDKLGYTYQFEDDNPAYQLFLN